MSTLYKNINPHRLSLAVVALLPGPKKIEYL